MKRFSPCSLLIAMLILMMLSIASLSAGLCEEDPISFRTVHFSENNKTETFPLNNGFSFTERDTSSVPVGFRMMCYPRSVLKISKTGNHSFRMLKYCFSLLTNRQLYTTKLTFATQYSQKEKNGYYIYELQKLLI
ncbi:MAG: hypothetical protein LIO93_01605 [Bacteroidales bacterium]|nr:hypothetical protein [Bacteroidales bacterium]